METNVCVYELRIGDRRATPWYQSSMPISFIYFVLLGTFPSKKHINLVSREVKESLMLIKFVEDAIYN